MIGDRIKQLRLARGLSLDALAAELGGIVTKQALSKYEKGLSKPSPVVLNRLAGVLGVKAARLYSEPVTETRFLGFRKGSTLGKKEQARIQSLVKEELEKRLRLQELIGEQESNCCPVQELMVGTLADVEEQATALRDRWGLGNDPIASVVDTLEAHSVHVVEIEAEGKFDGISAVAGDARSGLQAAAVISRLGVPGERQRLNLAHELGHLVLKVAEGLDEEKVAFRFGAAFLAPADTLRKEVGTRRALIQGAELLLLKKRFGMSMQALLYRLRDIEIISEPQYKQWCIEINRRGWRKQEPGELEREQPQWLQRNVLRLLSEGLITQEEGEQMLGQSIETSEPLSLIEKRAFMKLSLEERRKILAAQAEKAAVLYETDQSWKDTSGGDFSEY
jgi:transcriptional regulator with XRE-family HTH domain